VQKLLVGATNIPNFSKILQCAAGVALIMQWFSEMSARAELDQFLLEHGTDHLRSWHIFMFQKCCCVSKREQLKGDWILIPVKFRTGVSEMFE